MNCWCAGDVTAAMLVVKNKSIFLRWVLNSLFSIFSIIDPQHSCLVTWSQTAFPFNKKLEILVSQNLVKLGGRVAHKMLGMEWRERKRVNGVTEIIPSHCVLVEQIRIQLPGFKKEEIKWDLVVVRFVKDGWPKSNRSCVDPI